METNIYIVFKHVKIIGSFKKNRTKILSFATLKSTNDRESDFRQYIDKFILRVVKYAHIYTF